MAAPANATGSRRSSQEGREELAHYFAFDTELAAETVLLALAKSPAAKTTLDNAMAREAQPKLGADGERGSTEPPSRRA